MGMGTTTERYNARNKKSTLRPGGIAPSATAAQPVTPAVDTRPTRIGPAVTQPAPTLGSPSAYSMGRAARPGENPYMTALSGAGPATNQLGMKDGGLVGQLLETLGPKNNYRNMGKKVEAEKKKRKQSSLRGLMPGQDVRPTRVTTPRY